MMLWTSKKAVSGDIQLQKSDRLLTIETWSSQERSGLGDLGGHHKPISHKLNCESALYHSDGAGRVKER